MPRILLLDDDLAEIAALKRALAGAGHQAVVATNSGDALAAVARGAADAVLVAPECEGGEGAAALRALEAQGVPARALPRPLEVEAAIAAVGRALGGPRNPRLSPAVAGATVGAGSLAPRRGERTAVRSSAPPPRAPTFDMSSSAIVETAELRQAERELWWTREQLARSSASAVKPPPPPSPRPAAARPRRPLDRGWVEEMLRQAEQADYFDLLGLPPDCCRNDVLEAAGRLLEELAPERVPASDALLLDKVEEVRRVLAEARDVLAEDRRREEYRRALGR